MTPEIVHLSVLAPIGFVAIGSMIVLMGEVGLSRAKTFLGREVDARFIGSMLALIASFCAPNSSTASPHSTRTSGIDRH